MWRIKNRRGSNRSRMKLQWQVTDERRAAREAFWSDGGIRTRLVTSTPKASRQLAALNSLQSIQQSTAGTHNF